jgi:hypothetical protein
VRAFYVFVGLCAIVVMYIVVRTVRWVKILVQPKAWNSCVILCQDCRIFSNLQEVP